jgi:hypothetical protein
MRKLSQELAQARHDGDDEEVERLEDELEQLREEMEAYELDEIDERRFQRGYN